MKCIFQNVGPSDKAAGFYKYACQRPGCGIEGHSPHAAVWVDGIERVIGPMCLGRPFAGEAEAWEKSLLAGSRGRPGTALAIIFHVVGAKKDCKGKCNERAAQMDRWGVDGCRENRDTIIGWLKEAYTDLSWSATLSAGVAFMKTDWFRSSDPFGSLVDEAIRRAEATAAP